jgi:TetR/AcrR family fatty acid metabolism transcriptional regulator
MKTRGAARVRASARRRGRPPTPGLRDSILHAAQAIFMRRDYHEVQMDDVAAACGVGKGTLYRYFRSKRELYLAIVFDGIARLRAELEAALAAGGSPARQVERIVRGTLGFFWDRRFFFALIHRHESKPDGDAREWLRQRAQLAAMVEEALRRAMAAGHVRPIECRIAAEMLLGMMRGVNRYRARDDHFEYLVASVVEVFMRGVGTASGQRALAGGAERRGPRRRARVLARHAS